MAPRTGPGSSTDWSAQSLGDLEIRAAELAGHLPTQLRRALAAARKPWAGRAAAVRREPLAWGMQQWGPIPGADPASRIVWNGPGEGLHWQAAGHQIAIRHRAVLGPFTTVRDADRAARRFIAIGLAAAAADEAAAGGPGPGGKP